MKHLRRRVRAMVAAAAVLLALPSAAQAGDVKFSVAQDYPASTVTYNGTASPGAIAHLWRDGRADEHADMVISNLGGGPVIQYGTGEGRFSDERVVVDLRPRADGTFSVTVAAPEGGTTGVYRLGTRVRRSARGTKTSLAFSLPLYRGTP